MTASIVLLAAVAASAVPITDQNIIARESIQLFQSFCIKASGDRASANRVLGGGNGFARPLSTDTNLQLLGNDGQGWAIRSPSGASLMLGYRGTSHCEVRIAEADEKAIAYQFSLLQVLHGASADGSAQSPPRKMADPNLTFRAFRFRLPNGMAVIAATTSKKKIGEQQHLLTFDLEKN